MKCLDHQLINFLRWEVAIDKEEDIFERFFFSQIFLHRVKPLKFGRRAFDCVAITRKVHEHPCFVDEKKIDELCFSWDFGCFGKFFTIGQEVDQC